MTAANPCPAFPPASPEAIVHRPEAARFELTVQGHACVLTYRLDAAQRRVVFDHTRVSDALQGRGLAARLVATGLDWARAQGLQVVPACSYVAVYMRRHPETADLLAPRG